MASYTNPRGNDLAGCSIISPGCTKLLCDADGGTPICNGAAQISRPHSTIGRRAKWNGRIYLDEGSLRVPYGWKTGADDLLSTRWLTFFHDDVPIEFIRRVFTIMRDCRQHVFQVLTKRSSRLLALSSDLDWAPNIWMGVSVENADYVYRIDNLRKTGAAIKFLSLEPLLGDLGSSQSG